MQNKILQFPGVRTPVRVAQEESERLVNVYCVISCEDHDPNLFLVAVHVLSNDGLNERRVHRNLTSQEVITHVCQENTRVEGKGEALCADLTGRPLGIFAAVVQVKPT